MLSKNYYAVSFRYTDETYRSIENFRENEKLIINSPTPIGRKIPRFIKMENEEQAKRPKIFIFEMNNTQNIVMNIIWLSMKQPKQKEYKIHTKKYYNRFSYFGKSIVERNSLTDPFHVFIMEYIDFVLFKGKDHSKRASGFTLFPKKKIINTNEIIMEFIKEVFNIHDDVSN